MTQPGRRSDAGTPAPRRVALAAVALLAGAAAGCEPGLEGDPLPPIDPQVVQDQDDMTWDDYRPIPGVQWADPSLEPERGFKIALVAIDFPDQPFVITQPKGSDPFGNPQIDPIAREDVPEFYADFFMKPGEVNHGQTINGYWMEQTRGRFGITEIDQFGPYRMPRNLWEYGLSEWGQNEATPDGSRVEHRMEPDVDSLWAADAGAIKDDYDAVLRIYAGYDETGVWQEFGEMKFASKEDIPPEWGNPNPDKPRWAPTRYVEWTSWKAGAQQWGLSSMRQGENSGTITHELGHYAFRIPDLNNNPYVEPYRRVAAGPWDMMDRGSFNGPGGPHQRWVVPPAQGAAMPAGLMLRNRMAIDAVADSQVLTLSREALAESGPVVARVTARAVEPSPGEYAGIVVRLDGEEPHDRTPADDPAANPLSAGTPDYDAYTLEVVQRIGYDSFTPDNGVLLAKTKDSFRGRNGGPNEFNSFIWVIDAHPEDMDQVDFVRPDGVEVMRTIADYRQLNDALFHAGTDSGSDYEWTDEPNRLHFYVIDLQQDERGIRSYTLGVRSLDGAGPHARGVSLAAGAEADTDAGAAADDPADAPTDAAAGRIRRTDAPVAFTLTNSGEGTDIFRLGASVDGEGWSARLRNALVAVEPGEAVPVTVLVTPGPEAAENAAVTLTVTSESDPARTASVTREVRR